MSHSHDHSHENCTHDHSHDDHSHGDHTQGHSAYEVSAEAAANSIADAKSIFALIFIVVLTVCFRLSKP